MKDTFMIDFRRHATDTPFDKTSQIAQLLIDNAFRLHSENLKSIGLMC